MTAFQLITEAYERHVHAFAGHPTGFTMFNPNEPFPLWIIWRSISFLERLFFLALFVVSIYCLFSAAKTIVRLRSTRRLNPDQDRTSIQLSLVVLRKLMANVRQMIGATFYLFGFVLFTNLATIGNTVDSSKTPTGYYIFQNFLLQCAFAANAFAVYLVLHLIQWFLTRQIDSCSERLKVTSDLREYE